MEVDEVINLAKSAKEGGASRVCLGAAWREVKNNQDFDRVLEMVKGVNEMDMEVCCTLGMLTEDQAARLKVGLYTITTISIQ
jgi:biotin synthase